MGQRVSRVAIGEQVVDVTLHEGPSYGWRSSIFSPMTQDTWELKVKQVRSDRRTVYIAALFHGGEIIDCPFVESKADVRLNAARVVLGHPPLDSEGLYWASNPQAYDQHLADQLDVIARGGKLLTRDQREHPWRYDSKLYERMFADFRTSLDRMREDDPMRPESDFTLLLDHWHRTMDGEPIEPVDWSDF